MQILLESGADINARGMTGYTAMHAASAQGHTRVVQMLLEAGADIKARRFDGYTAMQLASRRGHEKVVQMLLDHRATAKEPEGGSHPDSSGALPSMTM